MAAPLPFNVGAKEIKTGFVSISEYAGMAVPFEFGSVTLKSFGGIRQFPIIPVRFDSDFIINGVEVPKGTIWPNGWPE